MKHSRNSTPVQPQAPKAHKRREKALSTALRREQEAARKEHARQLRAIAHAKRWSGKKGVPPTGVCPICGETPRDFKAHQQLHKKGHSPGFGREGIPLGRRRAPGSAFGGKGQR